ncbi:MAG: hypothetical protein LBV04_01530 [Deferribacteraceae bacterium]|jgi:hypothetical protein|nr:hypothetical protein [Deferribacteraceae bacterium]
MKKFLCCFCVLICAQVGFAQAVQDTQSDSQAEVLDAELVAKKAEAAKHLENGDYEAAYTIYAALLWDYPDDDDVNMGIAITARYIDRVFPALMALERLSVKYPRDMQIRRELLVVYLQVNDAESARREAEILRQNDIDLQGIDVLPTPSFLYSGYLSFGFTYNTNANAGLESDEILPGLILTGSEEVASPGTYLQGAVNGSYSLAERWWLVGDLNAYYHYNTASDLTSNTDILWTRAAAGARYAAARYVADLRLKADFTKQGSDIEDQKMLLYGLDGSFVFGLKPNILLTTAATLDSRASDTVDERQGMYWSLGEFVRVLFGDRVVDMTAGLRLRGASTDLALYDYTGWELSLRTLFYVKQFELTPSLAYRIDSYDGISSFLDTEDREDKQLRTGISGRWRFYEDWSTELSYMYTKNDSNSVLYDYTQHLITLSAAMFF